MSTATEVAETLERLSAVPTAQLRFRCSDALSCQPSEYQVLHVHLQFTGTPTLVKRLLNFPSRKSRWHLLTVPGCLKGGVALSLGEEGDLAAPKPGPVQLHREALGSRRRSACTERPPQPGLWVLIPPPVHSPQTVPRTLLCIKLRRHEHPGCLCHQRLKSPALTGFTRRQGSWESPSDPPEAARSPAACSRILQSLRQQALQKRAPSSERLP